MLPLEIQANRANPNFERNWGTGANYVSTSTISNLTDPLDFSEAKEYSKLSTIEEGAANFLFPIAAYNGWGVSTAKSEWYLRHGHFLQIRQVIHDVKDVFTEFISFLGSLKISEENRGAYESGLFSLEDIKRAGQILAGIEINKAKYQAGANGISNYWTDLSLNASIIDLLGEWKKGWNNQAEWGSQYDPAAGLVKGNYVLTFVGIREEFFRDMGDDTYQIALDTGTTGWENPSQADGIWFMCRNNSNQWESFPPTHQGTTIIVTKDDWFIKDTDSTLVNASKQEYKQSMIDWLHCVKGLHIDESVFIPGVEQMYSEFLVENAEDLFPWNKSDFKNGLAVNAVESMYNVSPWLFPMNFFMDVFKAREFRHIIPVLIKVPNTNLGKLYSTDEPAMFQGNIKFKLEKIN